MARQVHVLLFTLPTLCAEVVWSSQAGQDKRVAELLPVTKHSRRFFVDLACNDPKIISNSYALEHELGWRGICIDATDQSRRLFAASGRSCHFVRAIVGDNPSQSVLFRDIVPSADTPPRYNWTFGLSSAVRDEYVPTCWGKNMASCINVQTFQRNNVALVHTRMQVQTLASILTEAKAPRVIDYLSLDVEGFEDAVLRSPDLTSYRIRAVTIERPSNYARTRLAELGLTFLEDLEFDELWIRNSSVVGGYHNQQLIGQLRKQVTRLDELKREAQSAIVDLGGRVL